MTPPVSSDTPARGPDIFARVRFVMVNPTHPGNVGSAARAIKTMGFHDLHLVAPADPDILRQPEAIALASGAGDILDQARTHATLADALGPATLAFALTARARAMGPPPCDIREAAAQSATELARPDTRIAIVLGTERTGLSNEDITLCQRVCHIPANPAYSSLNVSQALQLAAWEMRYALLPLAGEARLPDTHARHDPGTDPASSERVQAMLDHFEQALVAVGFLDPRHPKKLLPRMRQMWTRNRLSTDEVDMVRGMCTAMIRSAGHATAGAARTAPTGLSDEHEHALSPDRHV
ncbi:RNA methyltransferase [Castellaniella sp.]|jgi:tRNA/rRNA methyltransferase|uniref:RNA methyltransferase n=1 Tax=Castellaniella sp. TaxID=1955812 RepID=UPI002D7EE8B6|nr:RNA methyltransferase [Castellaniella sp.]HET8702904.1 RNA methyltransferase [Castellaniella sp.]